MQPIKTCVLGVGLAGLTFHIPFVLALPHLFQLHAVLERNPTCEGGRLRNRFGISVTIHRSIEDVLSDPQVELVIIGTPNDTHYAFTKACLQAGKHVMVDKPVTATAAEANELSILSRAKGLVLYPFQNRRWDSDFLALRRLLSEPSSSPQTLGTVVEFESFYDRYRNSLSGNWKEQNLPGAGQTYNLGSHLIDQAISLFGWPDRITSFISNVRGIGSPDVDDSFDIFLHYDSSASRRYPIRANLRAHILSVRSPQLRFVVRGDKGTFIKYGLDVQEDQLKILRDPKEILDKDFGQEPEEIWGIIENIDASGLITQSRWPSEGKGAYIDIFRNLAAAIRNGDELQVKWEEAASVIEIIELAYVSSREGRTISVPQRSRR